MLIDPSPLWLRPRPPPGTPRSAARSSEVVCRLPLHTVVIDGMPGWQITLIAAATAIFAAGLAVILDRARQPGPRLAAPGR